jgi:hypothetical protein
VHSQELAEGIAADEHGEDGEHHRPRGLGPIARPRRARLPGVFSRENADVT